MYVSDHNAVAILVGRRLFFSCVFWVTVYVCRFVYVCVCMMCMIMDVYKEAVCVCGRMYVIVGLD